MNAWQFTRRGALCCGAALAAGLFTGLEPNPAVASLSHVPNPCRGALPLDLAKHELVLSAFDGVEAHRPVDVSSLLLGTGDCVTDEGHGDRAWAPRSDHPLRFDFVLKRHLHANGRRLTPSVFEARALPAHAATVRPVPPTAA